MVYAWHERCRRYYMTVLVVDDEQSLGEILRMAGYYVVTTGSGREALDYIGDGGMVRALLVDLNMPGMSGEELLMSLDELNIRPPALVISALAPWKLIQFLHEGIGYLRKPVNASLLLDTVESLIGKGEGGTHETEKAC
jgi:DNA-binding response OmpR family regulator